MKRLSGTEKGMLLLAAAFVLVGLYVIIRPADMSIFHQSKGGPYVGDGSFTEHVSREGARTYGLLITAFGAGIGWLILYRPRK